MNPCTIHRAALRLILDASDRSLFVDLLFRHRKVVGNTSVDDNMVN